MLWLCSFQPKVGRFGEAVVLPTVEDGVFWRRCCAHSSQRWGVLAKVVSCLFQPKVGCFGEGGVVLAPAEIGVIWRRCRCATPIQSWRCCGEGVVAVLTPSKGGGVGGECFGEGGVVALNSVGYLGEGDVMLTPLMLCSQRMGCLGEGGVVVLTSAKGGLFGRWWCRAHFSRGWGVWAKVWLCSFRQKAGSVFGEGVAVLTPAEDGVF